MVTTYFIEHRVSYAVFKLSFSKQYKMQCFNPLRYGLIGKQHEDNFCTTKYFRNTLSKPYE